MPDNVLVKRAENLLLAPQIGDGEPANLALLEYLVLAHRIRTHMLPNDLLVPIKIDREIAVVFDGVHVAPVCWISVALMLYEILFFSLFFKVCPDVGLGSQEPGQFFAPLAAGRVHERLPLVCAAAKVRPPWIGVRVLLLAEQ